MRVKATRQILKVCSDAVGARVLGVVSMKGKPMVDICWIAIDKLTPNGRNARTHSRKQIRQIADSIEAFGFVVPILMDDDGVIIAGHGRYAAAKLLDLKQVPAIRLGELSEAKRSPGVILEIPRDDGRKLVPRVSRLVLISRPAVECRSWQLDCSLPYPFHNPSFCEFHAIAGVSFA
jgi:hypothetical protein